MEERKLNHFQDNSERHRFKPVARDTTGSISCCKSHFLSELVRRIVSKTGEREASALMYQRILVPVMRSKSASIILSTQH